MRLLIHSFGLYSRELVYINCFFLFYHIFSISSEVIFLVSQLMQIQSADNKKWTIKVVDKISNKLNQALLKQIKMKVKSQMNEISLKREGSG